jgi:hypothetical protein
MGLIHLAAGAPTHMAAWLEAHSYQIVRSPTGRTTSRDHGGDQRSTISRGPCPSPKRQEREMS